MYIIPKIMKGDINYSLTGLFNLFKLCCYRTIDLKEL